MGLILRTNKGTPLTYQEMDGNLTYLEGLSGGPSGSALTGSFSGSFTGSYFGTASYANNAVTASYYEGNSISSSFASTSSYSLNPVFPYKKYVALLSQTSTNAPVATVLENTLGFVPFLSYSSAGVYLFTSSAGFTTNKTAVFFGVAFGGTGGNIEFDIDYGTPNDIYFYTRNNTGTNVNDLLKTTPVEIRIYP